MADTMKMFVFEGTPIQLAEMAKSMGASPTAIATAIPVSDDQQAVIAAAGDGEAIPVTTEFARKVLSRRSLSKEQRQLLVLLANAGKSWSIATKLQSALGYSKAQFAGMMGAFGRRITHTAHFVNDSYFFDQEWLDDKGCYHYRLPETVLAALRAEKII